MAQGTRGRWVRAIVAGLGVTFSTSLVGCMNWDKPKETKSTTPPKAGLPGTPTLPAGGTAGGAAQPKWSVPGAGQYTGAGSNIQPNNNFATGAPPRTGTNNLNTTAGPNPYGVQPAGASGTIGAPGVPGVAPFQPAGGFGPVGAAPLAPSGGVAAGYGPTSPLPSPADLTILPPAPPSSPGSEFAGVGSVLPPNVSPNVGPIAPPASPPTNPQNYNFSPGVFGSK